MDIVLQIMTVLISLAIGAFGGFWYTKNKFEKNLAENPPINEKMIRAMYMQMGRKASEAQIRQTMNAMNQYKK